jgi:hypothetical protein
MGQATTLKPTAAVLGVFTQELKVYQWPTTIPVTDTDIAPEHAGVSPQGNPQSTCMANEKADLSGLDLQATLGLLRICTRLLPYKESSAEALLKSLQLVLRLDPHVAWDLAQQIATELLKLVKSSAAYIRYAQHQCYPIHYSTLQSCLS